MRPSLFLIAVVFCPILAVTQTAEKSKTQIFPEAGLREATAQLTDLAAEAGHAYASRDMAALERLTAEDYVQTDVRGGVLTRSQWLEFVKNRKSNLTVETDNVQISFYGTTAVVRGHWTYTSKDAEGKDIVKSSQWTSVWTLTPDGWKRHAFQNTYVNLNADHCPQPRKTR